MSKYQRAGRKPAASWRATTSARRSSLKASTRRSQVRGLAGKDLLAPGDRPVQHGASRSPSPQVRSGAAPEEDPARCQALEPLVHGDRTRQRPVRQRQRQRVRRDGALRVGQEVACDLVGHHLRAAVGDPRRLLEPHEGVDIVEGERAPGGVGKRRDRVGKGGHGAIVRRPPGRRPCVGNTWPMDTLPAASAPPTSSPTPAPRSRTSRRCAAASTARRRSGSTSRRPRRSSSRSCGRSGLEPRLGTLHDLRDRGRSRAPGPARPSSCGPTWTACR